MARCLSCNGVITGKDVDCFVCGEPIPGRSNWSLSRLWTKSAKEAAQRVTFTESTWRQLKDPDRDA